MTLVLRYIARSDRGLVRANNEDSVYAGARLLALADGMGGHAAGEVASQLAIQALRTLDDDEPGGDLLDALAAATRQGNEAIADEVARNPELDGMGTTLTAILFAGTKLGLCQVGDSRGYLLRGGGLTQITRDDTFVQSLVDEGRITAEQAHSHPQRSLILKALTGQPVEPTLQLREARAGDRYLLCSDGLSDVVSEETIAETLATVDDHATCANRLIELALRSGAPDNVTVVVADVVDTEYGESRPILGGAAGDDDEAGYAPDPSTAAGRAAALRPPASPTQRPSIGGTDPEPAPRSPWRLPVLLIALAAVAALLVTAFFVVRSKAMSNYYVTSDGDIVVVDRGTPDGVMLLRFSEPGLKVCVENLASTTPRPYLADLDSSEYCPTMKLADLTAGAQKTVNDASIRNLTSRAAVEESLSRLTFLPCAVSESPENAPPNQPTERPAESTAPTSAPRSTNTGPSSGTERTVAPGSTPPATGSTEKTRDCSGV